VIASAPGKLLVSGAYAVLVGAPALVSAVDRRALADASRTPELLTDEVRAAIELGGLERAPWFDASALRTSEGGVSRKLGLGSSAAILAASLGAVCTDSDHLRASLPAIFELALRAHRRAQGGGSGVDVAASVFGGTLRCRLGPGDDLSVEPQELPRGAEATVFAYGESSSTRELLAKVRALREARASEHDALLDRAAQASEQAVTATNLGTFLDALAAQLDALEALGHAAGASIVLPSLRRLASLAAREGAVLGTAGAGGGDLALLVGPRPPSPELLEAARELGWTPTDLRLGGPGLQAA
jgi:phosphomevalonate kinase